MDEKDFEEIKRSTIAINPYYTIYKFLAISKEGS